uniref:Poly [ADP-ribose] polymerase n=1 Tax=Rhabditophanes sp. KR3021 TaxID=114890 RepID=A0AC35TWI5_9BILA
MRITRSQANGGSQGDKKDEDPPKKAPVGKGMKRATASKKAKAAVGRKDDSPSPMQVDGESVKEIAVKRVKNGKSAVGKKVVTARSPSPVDMNVKCEVSKSDSKTDHGVTKSRSVSPVAPTTRGRRPTRSAKGVNAVKKEKSESPPPKDDSPAPNARATRGAAKKGSVKKEASPAPGPSTIAAKSPPPKDDSPAPKAKRGAAKKGAPKKDTAPGRYAVDPFFRSHQTGWHVYEEDGYGAYSVMLNQTCIGKNNNKFFLLQLLERDNKQGYVFMSRWGRVGVEGQQTHHPCIYSSVDGAKTEFARKFKDKSGNVWNSTRQYVHVDKKYDYIDMGGDEEPEEKEDTKSEDSVEDVKCTLDERVARVMEIICNTTNMEKTLVSLHFDVKKMPIGKISKNQISIGYQCLKDIEAIILSKNTSSLEAAVNKYYTMIPHAFGMRVPKMIATVSDLKEEIDLLDALFDIEASMVNIKEAKEHKKEVAAIHRHDDYYNRMKCELSPLDAKDKTRKMLEKALQGTHCPTHYGYKTKVMNVYELKRNGEDEKYMDKIGNKKLLWHGSRVTNWYGILSQGLRIAPPEAPVTGYMFDKGIYMADCASKSINYCFPQKGQTGFIGLVEAALGNPMLCQNACSNARSKLKADQQSTKGCGRSIPKTEIKLKNGVVFHDGPIIDDPSIDGTSYCQLAYNEFIVYDVDQIKLKYLLELEYD